MVHGIMRCSADLKSAVSPLYRRIAFCCARDDEAVANMGDGTGGLDARQVANPRYSRVQLCATAEARQGKSSVARRRSRTLSRSTPPCAAFKKTIAPIPKVCSND